MTYRSHGNGQEWRVEGTLSFKKFGKGSIIECSAKVFHPQLIEIGTDSYIGNDCILKGYPYNSAVSIRIGNDCWVGERVYIHGAGGVDIEDRVGIGPCVQMLTSYHDYRAGGKDRIMDNPLAFKGIRICEGADIQAGSFICAGVTIGKYASVRAYAVVTKDVPEKGVVEGNPAKLREIRGSATDLFKA